MQPQRGRDSAVPRLSFGESIQGDAMNMLPRVSRRLRFESSMQVMEVK